MRTRTAAILVGLFALVGQSATALATDSSPEPFRGAGSFVGNDSMETLPCGEHVMSGTFTGSVVVGDEEIVRVESSASWVAIPNGDPCHSALFGSEGVTGQIEQFEMTAGPAGDFSVVPESAGGTFSLTGNTLTVNVDATCKHDSREDYCPILVAATWIPYAWAAFQPTDAHIAGSLSIPKICPHIDASC